ncbi:MAG: hypothetical protein AAB962_00210 [Patescibacteria group bacterium]
MPKNISLRRLIQIFHSILWQKFYAKPEFLPKNGIIFHILYPKNFSAGFFDEAVENHHGDDGVGFYFFL